MRENKKTLEKDQRKLSQKKVEVSIIETPVGTLKLTGKALNN